jgi:hypothetical protein
VMASTSSTTAGGMNKVKTPNPTRDSNRPNDEDQPVGVPG